MNLAAVGGVGAAGAAGAVARFAADAAVRARVATKLPVATIAINVSGSLVLGVLTGLVVWHHVTPTLTLVAGTGFCGGYTTFSSASVEGVRLAQQGRWRAAVATTLVTVAGAVGAAALGMALASL